MKGKESQYYLKSEYYKGSNNSSSYPVDTERKLNLHKTFRRRPGRLLNALCTFNLRPVTTGLGVIFRNSLD